MASFETNLQAGSLITNPTTFAATIQTQINTISQHSAVLANRPCADVTVKVNISSAPIASYESCFITVKVFLKCDTGEDVLHEHWKFDVSRLKLEQLAEEGLSREAFIEDYAIGRMAWLVEEKRRLADEKMRKEQETKEAHETEDNNQTAVLG